MREKEGSAQPTSIQIAPETETESAYLQVIHAGGYVRVPLSTNTLFAIHQDSGASLMRQLWKNGKIDR